MADNKPRDDKAAKPPSKSMIIMGIVSFIFLAAGLIIGIHSKNVEEREMQTYPAYTWAAIDGAVKRGKTSSILYHFEVDGKRYDAKSGHKNDTYMRTGDTCQVLYSSNNPEYSKLVRDDEGRLKLKRFTGKKSVQDIFDDFFDD